MEGGFRIKVFLILAGAYAVVRIVEAIVEAIEMLLKGLVIIGLASVVALSIFSLYRYMTDKQFGETRSVRKIAQWERLREYHLSQVPEHLHEKVNEYYAEKMHGLFDTRPHSRFDAALDKTKQVISTFRKAA